MNGRINTHVKRLLVTSELIIDMFSGQNFRIIQCIENMIPPGAEIIMAFVDPNSPTLNLVIEHESFESWMPKSNETLLDAPLFDLPVLSSITSGFDIRYGIDLIVTDFYQHSGLAEAWSAIDPVSRAAIVDKWKEIMVDTLAPGIFVKPIEPLEKGASHV